MGQAALSLAREGFHVLPLAGKVPIVEGGAHAGTRDEETIRRWWSDAPNANIGIATGRELPGGGFLVVIDVDPRNGGEDALRRLLERHHAEVPSTRTIVSGGGGVHLWLRADVALPGFVLEYGDNGTEKAVELKGESGYIVAPPSVHPETKAIYEANITPIAAAPEWLYAEYLEVATKRGEATEAVPMSKDDRRYPDRIARGIKACQTMPAQADGTGGGPLWNLALRLVRSFELPLDAAHELIVEHFNPRATDREGNPWPWSDAEIDHKLTDARDRGTTPCGLDEGLLDAWKARRAQRLAISDLKDRVAAMPLEAPTFALTDLGNAERFAYQHRDFARYVGAWKTWMVWDGKRWERDDRNAAALLAKATARSIDAEVRSELDDERRKKIRAHATRTESRAGIENMLALARSELGAAPGDFDVDPWLLNVANGTIDLRTGQLRPHTREDMLTKLAPVDFDPDATSPTWDAFLAKVLPDARLVAYLQRIVGYALVGVTSEHVLVFSYGSGANGKGVFHNTIARVLGDFASKAPRGLLVEAKSERHPTELADLFGARFVLCSEVKAGQRFDEGLVKDLVGEDEIKARRMHQDFWSFRPTHTLFICGNHKPRVDGADDGIWRRIHLVPWSVTIPEGERDQRLLEKLAAEGSGILAWAVRGCLDWQAKGLGAPTAVKDATNAYRAESNPLHDFFASRCTFDPDALEAKPRFRAAYEAWARETGHEPLGARRFAEALAARDVLSGPKVRDASGPRESWKGIKLAV